MTTPTVIVLLPIPVARVTPVLSYTLIIYPDILTPPLEGADQAIVALMLATELTVGAAGVPGRVFRRFVKALYADGPTLFLDRILNL